MAGDVAGLPFELICSAWRAAAVHPIAFVPRATQADTVAGCRAWGYFFGSITALSAVFASGHAFRQESPSDTLSTGLQQIDHGRFLHASEALACAVMGGGACRVPFRAFAAFHARHAAVIALDRLVRAASSVVEVR